MTRDNTSAVLARRGLVVPMLALLLGGTIPAGAQEKTIRFKVVNATEDEIREIYVCPTGASKWGSNLLAEAPLRSDGSVGASAARPLARGLRINLGLRGDCGLYDIRLVLPGGKEYMEEELSFCEDDDVVTVGNGELKKASARRQE